MKVSRNIQIFVVSVFLFYCYLKANLILLISCKKKRRRKIAINFHSSTHIEKEKVGIEEVTEYNIHVKIVFLKS